MLEFWVMTQWNTARWIQSFQGMFLSSLRMVHFCNFTISPLTIYSFKSESVFCTLWMLNPITLNFTQMCNVQWIGLTDFKLKLTNTKQTFIITWMILLFRISKLCKICFYIFHNSQNCVVIFVNQSQECILRLYKLPGMLVPVPSSDKETDRRSCCV